MSAATKPELSEAAFQAQFLELARILGWRHMFVRRSMGGRKHGWTTATDCPGYPDLTLWHPTQQRQAWVELKTDKGRLTDNQREVLASLVASGADVKVWRPCQFDELHAWLRGES